MTRMMMTTMIEGDDDAAVVDNCGDGGSKWR